MGDWDIELVETANPDKSPTFKVVYLPGIGRYGTKGQAARIASAANGYEPLDPIEVGFRLECLSITRERNKKDKKKK